MKQLLKSPFLALVIVGALAAGTALLAGYVDGPSQGSKVTADAKCGDCPKAGTEACCKVRGECEKDEAFATPYGQGTCAAKPAAGSCQEMAQPAPCSGAGCQMPAQSSCGAGGCTRTE